MARCKYKTILKKLERCRKEILSGSFKAVKVIDELIAELKEEVEKEKNADPRVRELISYACRTYEEETGLPMAVEYGTDGSRIKAILKRLKPLAKTEKMKEEELFKILWDFFVNRYTRARTGGIASFQNTLQRVYEWWKKEKEAPIDFGGESIATNPKFGLSPEFNTTKIQLTESED